MQRFGIRGFLVLVALCSVAEPGLALTTTYYWAAFDNGSTREDAIYWGCQAEPPSFPAEFPELCGGTMPAQLSVTFEHDQRIWDNDASGCAHPESGHDIRCRVTEFEFDELVGITLSGVAFFDPSEILAFQAIDFLGTCPGICEFGPPFIVFRAVDALTGLEISVSHDDFAHDMELLFADGRFLDDEFRDWGRGRSVPEPGALGLFALGLAGLSLRRRRSR